MLEQLMNDGTKCLINNQEKAKALLERKMKQNPDSEDLKNLEELMKSKINCNTVSSLEEVNKTFTKFRFFGEN